MHSPVLAIKVDVDTYAGTRDNVPRLFEIFERFGIRATFYFSLGPDNSGKAVRRIFMQKGFLKKALRTRGLSACSFKEMLYGTLLPAPHIASSLPEILLQAEKRGHEVGIHGWDHVKWLDLLPWFPKPVTAMELGKAGSRFERIFGRRARTTAAPGWIVSQDSLEVQDAMGLDYCSDCRGSYPFYPLINGRRFRTLQIPTTWPTMDEIFGENGISLETINSHYLSLLRPGLNVHNIQAEMEGGLQSELFIDLLERLTAAGVRFITLCEVAEEFGSSAPYSTLEMGELAGMGGKLPYSDCDLEVLLEPVVHFYRVDRHDLVYLKFVLEAYEGMSTLSTVEPKGVIVRLSISPGFEKDMQGIINALSMEIPLTEVEFEQGELLKC